MVKPIGRRLVALAWAGSLFLAAPRAQNAGQTPTFRASADVIVIDAQVVARDGTPIADLKPDQFEAFLDGRKRSILSAEFVRASEAPANTSGGASGVASGEGRLMVIGVDEGSFPVSAQASAREAARRVIDRAAPADRVGLVTFPGAVRIPPTTDRAALRDAAARIVGARVDITSSRFNISAAEAVMLKSREAVSTQEIIARECREFPPNPTCPREVIQDGSNIAIGLEQQAMSSVSGLDGLLDAMASLPGRKTLILISAGLPMSNRPGSQLNMDSETTRVARRAAAANVSLYVFYMNVHFLRSFSPQYGRQNHSIYDDIAMFGLGLEKFADSGGGSFSQIEVDADPFVDRALRETSASYLLAVRLEPADRDGKDHFVRVAVKARGATVRYRRIVAVPRAGG
jgi:VWFA-related protein